MRIFKKALREVSPALLAGELLDKLQHPEAAEAAERDFPAHEAKEPGTASWDFDAEQEKPEPQPRKFPETEDIPFQPQLWAEDRTAKAPQHEFDDHEPGGAERIFYEPARNEAAARDFPAEEQLPAENAEFHGGALTAVHIGTKRSMEEISDFFRRDARRYDGGFRQY